MPEGTLEFFAGAEDVGVIRGDDGARLYVRRREVDPGGTWSHGELTRVRYDVVEGPGGPAAANVAPAAQEWVRLSVTTDEWPFLEDWCRRNGLEARFETWLDWWGRTQGEVAAPAGQAERVRQGLKEIAPRAAEARPGNPAFVVYFRGREGGGEGSCVVGADSPQAARELAARKLGQVGLASLLPRPPSGFEVEGVVSLPSFEDAKGIRIPSHTYPEPGEMRVLDLAP